jgi:hypothetical protein
MPYEGKTFAEHGGSLERKNRILGHMKGKHFHNTASSLGHVKGHRSHWANLDLGSA